MKRLLLNFFRKYLERRKGMPMAASALFYHESVWPKLADFQAFYSAAGKLTDMPLGKLLTLYQLLLQTRTLSGSVAECGVAHGGSASVLARTLQQAGLSKALFLLDSFEGMPEVDPLLDAHFKAGDYGNTSLEEVQKALQGLYPDIRFIKGYVEKTLPLLRDEKFSFVHIDVDLLQGTRSCIEFFYPRMVPGGIILNDDYGSVECPGARKAMDDFMADKPEKIILLPTTQGMIIKL